MSGKVKGKVKGKDKEKEKRQKGNAIMQMQHLYKPTVELFRYTSFVRSFLFFQFGDFSMEGSCCARPPCFAYCADIFVDGGRKGME